MIRSINTTGDPSTTSLYNTHNNHLIGHQGYNIQHHSHWLPSLGLSSIPATAISDNHSLSCYALEKEIKITVLRPKYQDCVKWTFFFKNHQFANSWTEHSQIWKKKCWWSQINKWLYFFNSPKIWLDLID